MKIKKLEFIDDHGRSNYYVTGHSGVERIEEYRPKGEGDKWFYDVFTKDTVVRVFKFNSVEFSKD